MEISIIVPVYKVESYLRRSVDSILAQTFRDFELILVDDGSPDSSGAICDQYAAQDPRVHVIHRTNGGAAAARNTGLDAANGNWIAFIDSDDWVHPDYLRFLRESALQAGADVAACRYQSVQTNAATNFEPMSLAVSSQNREAYWIHDRVGAVVPWGKLYKHELFAELRYPVGRTAEDEYVAHKIIFGCKQLVVLDNVMYYYFVNIGGVSRNNYVQRLPDILEAFRLHEEYFKDSPWQQVYQLEVEHRAAAWSDAIWITKKQKDPESRRLTKSNRAELRRYLRSHKNMISVAKRKDIYIAAYPCHAWFIRGYGLLMRVLHHG